MPLGGNCCCGCNYFIDDFSADDRAERWTAGSGTWSISGGALNCTGAGTITCKVARPLDAGQPADAAYCVSASATIATASAGDTITLSIGGYGIAVTFSATSGTLVLSGPGVTTQTTTISGGITAPYTLNLCIGAYASGKFYALGSGNLYSAGASPGSSLVSITSPAGCAIDSVSISKTSPDYQSSPPCPKCNGGTCTPGSVGCGASLGKYDCTTGVGSTDGSPGTSDSFSTGNFELRCIFCLTESTTVDIAINATGLGGTDVGESAGVGFTLVSGCLFGGGSPVSYSAGDYLPPAACLSPPDGAASVSNSYTLAPGTYLLVLDGSCGATCCAVSDFTYSISGVMNGFGSGCCG